VPPFVFSLEQVLEHRRRLEEDAQKAVALVQMRLDECQGAIARLEASRKASSNELYARLAGGAADGERMIYTNYLQLADQELKRLGKLELEVKLELERARRSLVEAMRNREILDEVRKAEFREYQRTEDLTERKQNDELAQRAWRASAGENLAAPGRDARDHE